MRYYYEQQNIGTARYVVSFHDGYKMHADGSPFYDMASFKSRRACDAFIRKLRADGYVERPFGVV